MNEKMKAAISYAKKGYAVFPLHNVEKGKCSCGDEDCNSPGKHPRRNPKDLTNGHKNATTDLKRIKRWWKRWPDANIGLVTGHGLTVIDIDIPDGLNNFKKLKEKYGKVPKTVKQRTGSGGIHYFFKTSDVKIKCSSGKIAHKIDVRGEGGYVAVPPSDHISGNDYEWINDIEDTKLAKMPEWLIDLLSKGEKYCECVHSKRIIPEGQRDNDLTVIAGTLLAMGLDFDEMHQALQKANKKRCSPKLERSQVTKIAESIFKRESNNNGQGKKTSVQNKFLELVLQQTKTFRDKSGFYFAVIDQDGRKELVSLKSEEFEFYCRKLYRDEFNKMISQNDLKNIIQHVLSESYQSGNVEDVYIRIAGYKDKIYWDLANEKREIVEISRSGWKFCQEVPVWFYRPPGMLPLPIPVPGKGFKKLKRLLPGIKGKHLKKLMLGWLVGALNPEGPFMILVLNGNKGSSKSTLTEFLKCLIDPADVSLRSLSNNEEDLMIYAKNNWVVAFDNISKINKSMSDSLCRLCTKGGLSKRAQYTNDGEFVFKAKRPIIVNGIPNLVEADDLMDRALILRLPGIKKGQHITMRELLKRFEKARPAILADLCDAVSMALKNRNLMDIKSLPRMADQLEWILAAEEALPWKEGRFLKIYKQHVSGNLDSIYLSDTFVFAVKSLLDNSKDKKWEGLASTLLKELKGHLDYEEHWSLPSFNKVSSALKHAAPALNHWNIKFDSKRNSRGTRIHLWK